MKILLTSNGITNTTIHAALIDLLANRCRVQRTLHSHRSTALPRGPHTLVTERGPMCALVEVGGSASSPRSPASRRAGSPLSRSRCAVGLERCIWLLMRIRLPTSCRLCGPRRVCGTSASDVRLPLRARPTTQRAAHPAPRSALYFSCFRTSARHATRPSIKRCPGYLRVRDPRPDRDKSGRRQCPSRLRGHCSCSPQASPHKVRIGTRASHVHATSTR